MSGGLFRGPFLRKILACRSVDVYFYFSEHKPKIQYLERRNIVILHRICCKFLATKSTILTLLLLFRKNFWLLFSQHAPQFFARQNSSRKEHGTIDHGTKWHEDENILIFDKLEQRVA